MPAHYALSEAVLVVAAIWCALRVWRNGSRMAAAGSALIGIAAAIGTVRFGLSAHEQLEAIHKLVSRVGGLIGGALIAVDVVKVFVSPGHRDLAAWLAPLVAATGIAVAFVWPPAAVFVVLMFTGAPVLAVLFGTSGPLSGRLMATALTSIMLLNILLVQRSPVLGPDISWHAYHLLIAVWLVAIAIIVTPRPTMAARSPVS